MDMVMMICSPILLNIETARNRLGKNAGVKSFTKILCGVIWLKILKIMLDYLFTGTGWKSWLYASMHAY